MLSNSIIMGAVQEEPKYCRQIESYIYDGLFFTNI